MSRWMPTADGLFIPDEVLQRTRRLLERDDVVQKSDMSNMEAMRRGRFFSNFGTQAWAPGGASEKPMDTPSYTFLRSVARTSPIDRLIMDTRLHQVRTVSRRVYVPRTQVGWRVVHERYQDPDFTMTSSIRERCLHAERIIDNVWKDAHQSFTSFLSACAEEEMTIDRKCAVIIRDQDNLPISYYLLDGAGIKSRLQVLLPFMKQQGIEDITQASLMLSDRLKIDLTKTAYVQEIDGQIVSGWEKHQISVNSVDESVIIDKKFWGRSPLEKSLAITLAIATAWNYNQQLFDISYPQALLVVLGDYDEEGLMEFRRQISSEQGPGGPWRLPVIPGAKDFDVRLEKLRDTPRDMLFSEWLTRVVSLKCAAYHMHPSNINWESNGGGGVQVGPDSSDLEIREAKEDGLYSFLQNMAAWLTEIIIAPRYPDLVMIWEGMDRSAEDARIRNLVAATGGGFMSVDEARAQNNMAKAKLSWEHPGDVIPNQVLITWLQNQQMQQQQEQAMAQQQATAGTAGPPGGPGGAPGGPPGGTGGPAGGQLPPGYESGDFGDSGQGGPPDAGGQSPEASGQQPDAGGQKPEADGQAPDQQAAAPEEQQQAPTNEQSGAAPADQTQPQQEVAGVPMPQQEGEINSAENDRRKSMNATAPKKFLRIWLED